MATYRKTLGTGLFLDIETYPGAGNVGGNYTPTTVNVYLRTSNGSVVANATKYGSLYIDGSKYDFSAVIGSLGNYSSKLLCTASKNVPHNTDGSKQLYVSCSFGIEINYSGSWLGTVSVDGSEWLATIPRASTPSVSGTLQLGSTITINTNRASGSFEHAIYYSWGSQITNKLIASAVGNNTTWTIPKDLANYIPNGTSGTLYIICETYNGGALIGTKTITKTINVPDTEEFRPSISEIALSEAQDGLFAKYEAYIQNQSKVYCTITANGAYSSTIKSYKAVINGTTYNEQSFTTDFLKLAGTNTISVTITDSRGRTATLTRDFEVSAYEGPSITKFIANRCTADGVLDDEGEFAKIEITATIPSLNNKNDYSYYFQYRDTDVDEYTLYDIELTETRTEDTIMIGGSFVIEADGDNSFDYMFAVADGFIPVNRLTGVETVFQLMNWNASGKGMAIGKVSEKDAFEVAMDMYDKFDTLITNGLAEYNWGSIDPNTTLSSLCITETNTPNENGFYFIMTFFYAEKSVEARRTQIAIPYIYDINQNKKEVFIRQYVDGSWNEWVELAKKIENYIVATISSSQKATGNARILLDTISEQSGTKLSLVSGAIKIGEGISKVRVSASFFIDNWVAGGSYGWGKIRKNGSNVAGMINSSSAGHMSTPISTTIVSVKSGDVIEMVFEGPAESTARAGRSNTWLCVEVIE